MFQLKRVQCQDFDMFFLFPSYPDVHPEVYVSSNDLSRVLQDDLNTNLHEHITTYITTGKKY